MVKSPKSNKKQPARHTHSTAAALEDATAVQNELIDFLTYALEYARQRGIRIAEILKQARSGPHAYDQDQESGSRITIRKRK
jgi:hypothetical protein